MLHAVSNAKHKIAEEDVDEEANGDLAKKVLPQILDEDKDNEREKDEEAGDENCSWVKNSRELLSRQTRPVWKWICCNVVQHPAQDYLSSKFSQT